MKSKKLIKLSKKTISNLSNSMGGYDYKTLPHQISLCVYCASLHNLDCDKG